MSSDDALVLIDSIEVDAEGSEPYSEEAAAQRYTALSYSSLNLLHECPRKFQLYRLMPTAMREKSVHLSFGSVVGHGMQQMFAGKPLEEIVFEMFMMWDMDLDFLDAKAGKSFWYAIEAVRRFQVMMEASELHDWRPLIIDDKPAAELGFRIRAGDYYYRGFIDLVIQNTRTGEIAVLECKTTGATYLNPATYANSSQGLSYSLPLDQILPDLSSYMVYYLVYMTSMQRWEVLPFEKHINQRAEFIRDLICDIRMLEMYKETGFPRRGSGCVSFNRVCGMFGSCGQPTEELAPVLPPLKDDSAAYQFTFDLEEIIARQEEHINEIVSPS